MLVRLWLAGVWLLFRPHLVIRRNFFKPHLASRVENTMAQFNRVLAMEAADSVKINHTLF